MENIRDIAIEFGEWLTDQGLVNAYPGDDWLASAGYSRSTRIWDTQKGEWLSMENLFDLFSAEKKRET